MELLVDIGNSRIKWCTPEDLGQGRVTSADRGDLQGLLEARWEAMDKPRQLWVSNVAGTSVAARLAAWTETHWQLSPRFVASRQRQFGVLNGYRNPGQLGVDRWMALLGARVLTPGNALVVDSGTATTLDAMDATGRHLGGLILPGVEMMEQTLLGNTALPPLGAALEPSCFATDTASGIRSAALLATGCLIESMLEQLRERVGADVDCIMTGGAVEKLGGTMKQPWRHAPHLVLIGLSRVAARKTDS